jgi:hypothetical protein
MTEVLGRASEAELGGRKSARVLSARVNKAKTLATDPPTARRLKKAAKQLKQFTTQLEKAVSAGKANATIGSELDGLAADAQAELAGLVTS